MSEPQGGAILGNSPAMRAVSGAIAAVAATPATALIRGESGAGKELIARAVRAARAPRRSRGRPLIRGPL